ELTTGFWQNACKGDYGRVTFTRDASADVSGGSRMSFAGRLALVRSAPDSCRFEACRKPAQWATSGPMHLKRVWARGVTSAVFRGSVSLPQFACPHTGSVD